MEKHPHAEDSLTTVNDAVRATLAPMDGERKDILQVPISRKNPLLFEFPYGTFEIPQLGKRLALMEIAYASVGQIITLLR